ncbi:MAG: hypothetical protein JRH15_18015 [Deltaproteobacteria bacterium]|nr:hypothetical protein [Deltaproteobacteria bacterium]
MGAQKIFKCLPVEEIQPDRLSTLPSAGNGNRHTLYLSVFHEAHLVENIQGKPFVLDEYYRSPELFQSKFQSYLPHISILVNAVYWEKRYPKFVTWDGLKALGKESGTRKLQAIADITCDIEGSFECNVKATDSGMPAYRIQPDTRAIEDGHIGDGIVLLAVDNLPSELPKDASVFFSHQLLPLVPGILSARYDATLDSARFPPEVKKADTQFHRNYVFISTISVHGCPSRSLTICFYSVFWLTLKPARILLPILNNTISLKPVRVG